jgi:hypothetical protein
LSLNTALDPPHKLAGALIAVGAPVTFTATSAWQPANDVYIIVVVPAPTPLTNPLEFIVAAEVLLLVQLPPVGTSLKLIVPFEQTLVDPEIEPTVLTVTTVVATQPEAPAAT